MNILNISQNIEENVSFATFSKLSWISNLNISGTIAVTTESKSSSSNTIVAAIMALADNFTMQNVTMNVDFNSLKVKTAGIFGAVIGKSMLYSIISISNLTLKSSVTISVNDLVLQ